MKREMGDQDPVKYLGEPTDDEREPEEEEEDEDPR